MVDLPLERLLGPFASGFKALIACDGCRKRESKIGMSLAPMSEDESAFGTSELGGWMCLLNLDDSSLNAKMIIAAEGATKAPMSP